MRGKKEGRKSGGKGRKNREGGLKKRSVKEGK